MVRCDCRYGNGHRRPFAAHAVQRNRSADELDVPLGDRQSEAGARRLRREVGLEHPSDRVGVHAHARVDEVDDDERRPGGGSNRQLAASRHRVERIFNHVGNRAREQRAIDQRQRQLVGCVDLDDDAACQPRAIWRDHFLDDRR